MTTPTEAPAGDGRQPRTDPHSPEPAPDGRPSGAGPRGEAAATVGGDVGAPPGRDAAGADAGAAPPDGEVDTGDDTTRSDTTRDDTGATAATPDRTGSAPVDGLSAADRRRIRRGWWAGAVPTLLVYAWIITVGGSGLLQRQYFDDFYDAQARALFHGRLDVPANVASFEGFLIDGKTYIYFGPIPALLRMPVLAVTDRFDGRLTTLSMLVAIVVLAVSTLRLACALRAMVRGSAPVGHREPLAAAGLAVATLAAPPLFLASAAVVYHEAAIWGLALSVAAFDAVARWLLQPGTRRLAVASALVTAAVLSRQSLGLGPLVALALGGALLGARRLRRGERAAAGRTAAVAALACLVPMAAVVGVNYAKFRTLVTPPIDRHVQSLYFPDRQDVLAAGHGSLWGSQFVPTTVVQYARPDGVDFRPDFPWIDFPRSGPSLIGDARFDQLDWASSIPASAPAATAGTIAAVVWAARARRRGRPSPWPVVLIVGAAAGAMGVIPFGYIANRYLNDLYPVVLIGGIVGFHAALARSPGWSPLLRRGVAAGGVVLVAFGAVTNVALALAYQRERGPVVPEAWRAEWVDWRLSLPGARGARQVAAHALLPTTAPDGQLAAVGDCDGLYVFVRNRWLGVERGPGVGVHDLRIDLDRLTTHDRVPLVTLGADRATIVALRRLDADRVRVDVSVPQPEGGNTWQLGVPVELSGEVTLRVVADARQPPSEVLLGRRVLNYALLDPSVAPPRYGRAPAGYGVAESFGGVTVDPVEPELCRRALDLAGSAGPAARQSGTS